MMACLGRATAASRIIVAQMIGIADVCCSRVLRKVDEPGFRCCPAYLMKRVSELNLSNAYTTNSVIIQRLVSLCHAHSGTLGRPFWMDYEQTAGSWCAMLSRGCPNLDSAKILL